MQAVANHQLEILAYTRSEGSQEYREKIAKYYHRNNIPVEASDIIVTTGGSEALLFAMGTVADAGDEIIIPEPFYANYSGFATASDVSTTPFLREKVWQSMESLWILFPKDTACVAHALDVWFLKTKK